MPKRGHLFRPFGTFYKKQLPLGNLSSHSHPPTAVTQAATRCLNMRSTGTQSLGANKREQTQRRQAGLARCCWSTWSLVTFPIITEGPLRNTELLAIKLSQPVEVGLIFQHFISWRICILVWAKYLKKILCSSSGNKDCLSEGYEFARAAVTKYHRLGPGGWKSKMKVSAGWVFPEASLLGLQKLPPCCVPHALASVHMYPCCPFPFLKGPQLYGIRDHP